MSAADSVSALVLLFFVALLAALGMQRQIRGLQESLRELARRLDRLESALGASSRRPEPVAAAPTEPPVIVPAPPAVPEPVRPPLPALPRASLIPAAPSKPPPMVLPQPPKLSPAPELPLRHEAQPIQWERFLGVKLFAWIGGLLMFLGVAFFIKYSFERNLIPPQMRVALGYLTGAGLLIAALRLSRERYSVTIQSLSAAAVLIFYASTFASHSFYGFLSAAPAFVLMVLATAGAFLLAVRLNAPVVGILGLFGGFLTPPLLSTGVDHPVGLFSYVALLDVGLLAVALRQRWAYQVGLACAGTLLTQAAWVAKFFEAEKFPVAAAIFLFFATLFAAGHEFACRRQRASRFTAGSALAASGAAFLFAVYLLLEPSHTFASLPLELFAYVFAADLVVLALAWIRAELRAAQYGSAAATYLLLAVWTSSFLTQAHLYAALGLFLLFGLLHAIFPVLVERYRAGGRSPIPGYLFPALSLLLVSIPILEGLATSLGVWPFVLLLDLLALGIAALTVSAAGILLALGLTVVLTAFWLLRIPAAAEDLPGMLLVVAFFALFFYAAGLMARSRWARPGVEKGHEAAPGMTRPAFINFDYASSLSVLLPFFLLLILALRLPLEHPSALFGLAALFVALALSLVRFLGADRTAPMALAGALLLECGWYIRSFESANAVQFFAWQLAFIALFLLFPFVWRRRFVDRVIPWATAALVAPLHFFLLHRAARQVWPGDFPGLVPALLALPMLAAVWHLERRIPEQARRRNTLLALFGGASLYFITLIFPIQLDKQWLTVAWALEGAALLWLFHRVPHGGLRVVGGALLAISFIRLAFNPLVFEYYPRSAVRLWNWWLYSYGIVTACLFGGAVLSAPPRDRWRAIRLPPILNGMGTVLAFFLLNIEIADWFSEGIRLQFDFSAGLGQDMAYSLAWGAFSLVLLGVGIGRNIAPARYAGLSLLVITILKLFLHDLWRLGGLFRIGSLIGLALMLILVSFFYQRFMASQGGQD